MLKHAIALGIGAVAIGLLGAGQASGALVASEPFNYTAGASLTGQTGGTGWSAGWTGTAANGPTVTAPGFNSFLQAGTGNKADVPNSNVGAFRVPSTSPDADATSLYISFLAQAPGATGYTGFSLFDAGNEKMFLGRPSGSANWGVDTKSNGVVNSTFNSTNLALLVFRIDFGGGTTAGNERVRMYVNPGATEPAAADVNAPDVTSFVWDNIRLQAGNGGTGVYDEIRMGTAYADVVVPEPASVGLLGLGVVGLLARRRRAAR